ncbi:MAG: 4Fe-4S binding protein [Peptococcaceae bacterium]|nr:4Fe-4S binding protein [Peptococcaceae bacterium]
MASITFNEEACKGCGLCRSFCPKGIIVTAEKLNSRGYHPATVLERAKCNGCTICAVMCPDVAIEISVPAGESH